MANVGSFDILCRFERDEINNEVRDGFEKERTVVKFTQSWGSRRSIMSKERFSSMQEMGISTSVWWFRYQKDITLAHRFTDDEGRLFEIKGIAEVGRKYLLEIVAEEIQRNIK